MGYICVIRVNPWLIPSSEICPRKSSQESAEKFFPDKLTLPSLREAAADCRPWLEAEIAVVKPKVIVALGATAAQAMLGPKFRVTKQRGEFIESTLAPYVMATVHPSSILRAPDDETRRLEHRRFVDDLKKLARVVK